MSARAPGRVVVVGAAGQVGGALCEQLGPRALPVVRKAAHPGEVELDLESLRDAPQAELALLDRAPLDAVVIAAGFTWVDGCEDDPGRAEQVNARAPAVLAEAAVQRGARTVYYSTEYVFDGRSGPYTEQDPVSPRSVYGRSKLAGERAVLERDPGALVLRTTVVYGPEVQGKNFAYQLAARLRAGERMRVPEDQISSPTYNRDLAGATLALLDARARGVFNVVGPSVLSRVDFAHRLARAAGLDPAGIEPVATAALGQRAERPLRAGLSIELLRRTLPDLALRDVEHAARDWIEHPRGRSWPTEAPAS